MADDTNQQWLSTTSYIENIRMLSRYVSNNLVFVQARSELLCWLVPWTLSSDGIAAGICIKSNHEVLFTYFSSNLKK